MTSVQQLVAARVILDESSPDFWSDAIVYSSLADGQNAAISLLIAGYEAGKQLSHELISVSELTTSSSISASNVNVPTGFLKLISVEWDYNTSTGFKPCVIVTQDKIRFIENNTYSAGTPDSPISWLSNPSGTVRINFSPAFSGSANARLHYIKTPTDIASGVNPALLVSTHDGIVFYAVAKLFQKDERVQESQYWMNLFNQEIKKVG